MLLNPFFSTLDTDIIFRFKNKLLVYNNDFYDTFLECPFAIN